jgi:four helix bundle protein
MKTRVLAQPVRSYRELIAWQKAIDLVTAVYEQTSTFPDSERFGLTSQLRRAAVSVPSNIAEGQGRASTGEFNQFLGHARGSLLEIETQVFIAQNLGFLKADCGKGLLLKCAEVGRILNGLMAALKTKRAA